jgi:hypothetical protein
MSSTDVPVQEHFCHSQTYNGDHTFDPFVDLLGTISITNSNKQKAVDPQQFSAAKTSVAFLL